MNSNYLNNIYNKKQKLNKMEDFFNLEEDYEENNLQTHKANENQNNQAEAKPLNIEK